MVCWSFNLAAAYLVNRSVKSIVLIFMNMLLRRQHNYTFEVCIISVNLSMFSRPALVLHLIFQPPLTCYF
jgi:hypothetical protein